MPETDSEPRPLVIDKTLSVVGRAILIVALIVVFVLRGLISGTLPITAMVAVICILSPCASAWVSRGFLVLAWTAPEFVCTLGIGSNPCEPLNVPRFWVIIV